MEQIQYAQRMIARNKGNPFRLNDQIWLEHYYAEFARHLAARNFTAEAPPVDVRLPFMGPI